MGNIKIWVVFVIGNSIKLQKLVLEGKISQVTSSHLGAIALQFPLSFAAKLLSFFVAINHLEEVKG